MNWYKDTPTRYLRCDIVSNLLGRVTVRVWGDAGVVTGHAHKLSDGGLIVEAG